MDHGRKPSLVKRTIMIFPKFDNMDVIDGLREKYDPLAKLVRPHITLVFPFESNIRAEDLKAHLTKALAGFRPFDLHMEEILAIDNALGRYLFLGVNRGTEQIKKISLSLYSGLLESFRPEWFSDKTYMPHITLGSFDSKESLDKAYREVSQINLCFSERVNQIAVEVIGADESSTIELEVDLQ